MKTEDFDDAIRKKLESVDQPYTEPDIDKVIDHLKKKHAFPRKGITGSTLMYSLVAAAMMGLLTWTLVKSPVNTPQNQEEPSRHSSAYTDTLKSAEIQADSRVEQQQPVFVADSFSINPVSITAISKPVPGAHNPGAAALRVSDHINTDRPEVAQPSTAEVSLQESSAAARAVTDTAGIISPETLPAQWINPSAGPVKDTLIPRPAEEQANANVTIKVTRVDPEAEVTQSDTTRVTTNGQASEPPESAAESVTGSGFFNFSGFRLGAGAELAGGSYGAGLTGSVSFARRLGFTTGVKYVAPGVEHFNDKGDFDRHDHRKINHRFEDHLTDQHQASEISIRSSLVIIPVSFSYTIPMNRNFSLLFALGTELDLGLNQQLQYNGGEDSLKPRREAVRARGDAVLFNNIVVSAGLEKRWNHLVFQAQPFIRPQLKQVFYKPKEIDFGIGLSILYSFGR